MISAFELDDLVTAGSRARKTHRVHGGFGAAVAEANHLHRETLANFLGQLPFHVVRHAKHSAGVQALSYGLHHRGMAMPGHQCAEAEVVVDVVIAIEIAKVRPLAFFDEDRIRIVRPVVTGNAQRNAFQVALVGFGGLRRAALEGIELPLQICVHRISPEILKPQGGY